jgi:hypothetical protein
MMTLKTKKLLQIALLHTAAEDAAADLLLLLLHLFR